ncbi:hypothetical protein CHO01_25380 [Cellulomonas hominis]|uniref:Uncharacterized protein n=1 Tax=Cellulomonas hominis TaxID=156981 RepID=A0A511FE22_9CELL|nr:hypothetical protein [Cellulomonas hominis]MBB5472505.1 hypothetical protein [Cellulomonas hominis]NKY05875.1 hypothetical protein [Cellulomonas hominis]GEL47422.1 hypothetical protein CHO01_25380 [Cellulomonas hominis]
MTADGTNPVVRAGVVETVEQLDALPSYTVVIASRTGEAWQRGNPMAEGWHLAGGDICDYGTGDLVKMLPATIVYRPDAPQPATTDEGLVTRAEVERMLAEQSEMDRAMHEAYRPEVVAEVAVHLSEGADWDAVAKWCGGTICTGQEPSGEYVSDMHIPGVGTAWQGAWIVQRHDGTFAIRAEVAGPSEASVAALTAGAGEAVDREALVDLIAPVLHDDAARPHAYRSYPECCAAVTNTGQSCLGRTRLTAGKVADTVLAARGDAAPSVTPALRERRLRACVERWPEAETGEYNPSCCRFPKSCSATVYDPEMVADDDLEVRP